MFDVVQENPIFSHRAKPNLYIRSKKTTKAIDTAINKCRDIVIGISNSDYYGNTKHIQPPIDVQVALGV